MTQQGLWCTTGESDQRSVQSRFLSSQTNHAMNRCGLDSLLYLKSEERRTHGLVHVVLNSECTAVLFCLINQTPSRTVRQRFGSIRSHVVNTSTSFCERELDSSASLSSSVTRIIAVPLPRQGKASRCSGWEKLGRIWDCLWGRLYWPRSGVIRSPLRSSTSLGIWFWAW